jgi:bacillithiol biosynthesis cysteine-adding enzyme BshC
MDYVDFAPPALRFYPCAPTMENLERFARHGLADVRFPRKEIAEILRRQNEQFGSNSRILVEIEELAKPDSVAVLTGQQVGIFGGPIYSIYKAMTAIHIAEELKKRGIRAVPIFWMETEDHDFSEATRRSVLDSQTSNTIIDYGKFLFDESEILMRSVGSIPLPENIRQATQDYFRHLPESGWKSAVQAQVEAAYKPGNTFALSFARLMRQVFQESGLVLFDPCDPEAKQLASSVFQKALSDADIIQTALRERKQELFAAGFHTQVSVQENATVLFLTSEGQRRVLEQHVSGFRLKNSDRVFSKEELQKYAQLEPEKFSPNVLLRPIFQDYLFPTVAYVGGSSEVAYFAQIETLYSLFGRPMPVIWPRNSFTLLDPEIGRAMDQLGLDLQSCFPGRESLCEKSVRASGFSKALGTIETLQEHLNQGLTEIRPHIQSIESGLVHTLENAQKKILHNVQRLKSRVVQLETKQNASIISTADWILNQCYPNSHLQERETGVLPFLARYGPSLMDTLHIMTEIENFAHRVIRLEDAE